ncbi:MAG: U32 family peptidase, partial [Erysipelotrichaceae bacterium]|nr:U32 family peptidase [Erysipelotrichaceae bacterium]
MKKCELLAPAKDLHKAKTAIRYGADAVYIGGKEYSLRARASNFERKDIAEAVAFAHEHNARLYVTVNIVFHDEDLYGIKEYLQYLESIGVDAVIIESPGLVRIVKKYAPKLECHISTQLSSLNSASAEL